MPSSKANREIMSRINGTRTAAAAGTVSPALILLIEASYKTAFGRNMSGKVCCWPKCSQSTLRSAALSAPFTPDPINAEQWKHASHMQTSCCALCSALDASVKLVHSTQQRTCSTWIRVRWQSSMCSTHASSTHSFGISEGMRPLTEGS